MLSTLRVLNKDRSDVIYQNEVFLLMKIKLKTEKSNLFLLKGFFKYKGLATMIDKKFEIKKCFSVFLHQK